MSVSKSLQKARNLSRKGETAQAISLYREVLDRYPQNRDAKKELRALAAAPRPSSAAAESAIIEFRALNAKGASKEILSKAQSTLQRFPDEAELHNLTGIALASLGKHQAPGRKGYMQFGR